MLVPGRLPNEIEALVEITEILAGPLPISEKWDRALTELARFTGSELVTLRRFNPQDATLELVASYNHLVSPESIKARLPSNVYLSSSSLKTRSPVKVNDYASNYPSPKGYVEGVNSALSIPILVNGEVFGTFGFGSRSVGLFTEDAVRVLVAIAALVGMAIGKSNIQLEEELTEELLTEATVPIVVVDGDGVIAKANRSLEELFGYGRGDLVGLSIEVLVPESLRDAHASRRGPHMNATLSRPMGEGLQLRGRRKDGREFPVAVGLSSIDTPDGHFTLAYVADDSVRVDVEDFLRTTGTQLGKRPKSNLAEMDLVDQAASIITSSLNINHAFEQFAAALKELVEFDHATINILDLDETRFIARHFVSQGLLEEDNLVSWEVKGSRTERAIQSGQTVLDHDLNELPGLTTDEFFRSRGLLSSILTPMSYNGRWIGSMSLASKKSGSFGLREQLILERLARQIAPAIENSRLYQEAISRTEQVECLLNLAEILGKQLPYEAKVSQLLDQIVQIAAASSAHLRVPDTQGQNLLLTASAFASEDARDVRPHSLGKGSIAFETFKQGHLLVIDEYKDHPDAMPLFVERNERSIIFLPIAVEGRPAALVTVVSKEVNHFIPSRVRLLSAIGEGLGTLLENSLITEELHSSTQEAAVVDEIAKIMSSTLDIDNIYERFALETKKLVDFDRATLIEVDRRKKSYTIRNTWGVDVPDLRIGTEIPLEGSSFGIALATEVWGIAEDLKLQSRSVAHSHLVKAGLRSHMLAPLVSNDEVIGAISFMSTHPGAFGTREQSILERLASQITPAFENARLYEETERRATDIQRLSDSANRILESNPSALAVLAGSDLKVALFNQAFKETFGLEIANVEGKPLSQFVDFPGFEECIRESLLTSGSESQRETVYPGLNGTYRWFLVSAVSLHAVGESDYEDEILLVMNEITEQKLQQERILEQSRLASVGELASGVAHEINNPLAIINLYSESMLDRDLPESLDEDVKVVLEQSQRAANIVRNLLQFARHSSPEITTVNAKEFLETCVRLKGHGFRIDNISVSTSVVLENPEINLDQQLMTQVILNILSNAEQACVDAHRGGHISILVHEKEGSVFISISDDGPGIPLENQSKVFDPFFTTKEVGKGTGLGLSVSYGIVAQLGGSLWVESDGSSGSTFHIQVPSGISNRLSKPTSTDDTGLTVPGSAANLRILVVDDEPALRRIIERHLGKDAQLIDQAGDGKTAWHKLQLGSYDCILLDIRMAGTDGQELFQWINASDPELAAKVIFITGDLANPNTRSFLDSLPNPVLEKPVSVNELRRAMVAVTEAH